MRKYSINLLLLLTLVPLTVYANTSGGGLTDYVGNGITSTTSGSKQPLDTGVIFGGALVDPRARTWTLSSGTDTVGSVQSGAWTTGRTWILASGTDSMSAVQSGTWTVQQGTPPWSVSQSGSWTTGRTWTLASGTDSTSSVQSGTWNVGLNAGTNLVGKVGIDQTTPGTTNGVQINAAIPTGTNSIGQVTANAGTNLNTSALALSASQTNGTQKTQTVDGSGNVVGPLMSVSGVNYLPVSPPIDVSSAPINVTTQDLVSTTAIGFANQSLITGTPTAGSAASYTVNSIQTVMVLISGTWTGTLSVEVTEDGIVWEPRGIHVVGTSTFASNITANVAGSMNAAGKSGVRLRATAAMTGTAVVKIVMSDNPSNFYVANSLKLVDGSATPNVNTLAIKAGSVSAATTDTGAVVALRPDSTIQTAQDKSGTGNITVQCTTPASCPANSTVTAPTNGASTVNFTLSNTFVATILFEGLDGNSTWQATIGTVPGNGSATAASGTPINLSIPAGGFSQIRARCSNYVSGTITAAYNVGAGLSTLQVFNLIPTALQATVQVSDGTNVGSVKAASTLPVLTDKAIVVTERPDNVGTPTQTSVSCAATSTTLLAASTATMFLSIRNPTTSTQTIWINVAGAAAVAAPPSLDLAPGAEADFFAEGSSFLPTAQINCISAGTSSSVSVVYK